MYNNLTDTTRYGDLSTTFSDLKKRLSSAYGMQDIDDYNRVERNYGYGNTLSAGMNALKQRLGKVAGSEGTGANRSLYGYTGVSSGLDNTANTMSSLIPSQSQRKTDVLKNLLGQSLGVSGQQQGTSLGIRRFDDSLLDYDQAWKNILEDRKWNLYDSQLLRDRQLSNQDYAQWLEDQKNSWWKSALGILTGGLSKVAGKVVDTVNPWK